MINLNGRTLNRIDLGTQADVTREIRLHLSLLADRLAKIEIAAALWNLAVFRKDQYIGNRSWASPLHRPSSPSPLLLLISLRSLSLSLSLSLITWRRRRVCPQARI